MYLLLIFRSNRFVWLQKCWEYLKENVTLHRGMSYKHYQNYVKWYLYFRNTDNKKRGK